MNDLLHFELKRKLVHILLTGVPLLVVYFNLSKSMALLVMGIYFGAWMLSEYVRVYHYVESPTAWLIRHVSRSVQKKQVKKSWSRIRFPFWIVGSTFVLIAFDYRILILSTLVLVIGDSASALIRAGWFSKNREVGYWGGVLVSSLALFLVMGNPLVSILVSAIGMIGERVDSVPDNLSIPILAGLAAFALYGLGLF